MKLEEMKLSSVASRLSVYWLPMHQNIDSMFIEA